MAVYKNSLSYILLTVLEGAVDGVVLVNDFAKNPANYSLLGRDYPLRKSSLALAIKRLRQKGLIEQERKADGEIILKLTDEGRTTLLFSDREENEWDGKWRIVIFDIPEQKRIIRNMFRRNLKKWGFKHLQKSVWISKKDIYEKLNSYIRDLGIEKWVIMIEANKLTGNIIS